MQTPADYWKLYEELTVTQATLLILDEDPAGFQGDYPTGADAVLTAISKGIYDEKLNVKTCDNNGIQVSDWRQYIIKVSELKTWLLSNDCKPSFFFEEITSTQDYLKKNPSSVSNNPSYLDMEHPLHSSELSIAISAWEAVLQSNPSRPKTGTRKQLIENWLKNNHSELNQSAFNRITTMLNPDKTGGAPKTE